MLSSFCLPCQAFISIRYNLNMLSKCILKLVMIIIIFKVCQKKCRIMVKTQTFRYSIISSILCSMETGLSIPIYITRLKLHTVSIQNMLMSMKAKMTVYRLKKSKRMNSYKSQPIQAKTNSKQKIAKKEIRRTSLKIPIT